MVDNGDIFLTGCVIGGIVDHENEPFENYIL